MPDLSAQAEGLWQTIQERPIITFHARLCSIQTRMPQLFCTRQGGDATPDAIYRTFLTSGNSVHYGVGTDGSIWQYVPEALGAGGNCCVEDGYDPFWTQFNPMHVGSGEGTNLNTVTISIEHCDAALDNSTSLSPAQQEASFKLVAYLVQKYTIPLTHIKGHNSLDPIDKAHCPGNYPWQALFAFLQNGGRQWEYQQGGRTMERR